MMKHLGKARHSWSYLLKSLNVTGGDRLKLKKKKIEKKIKENDWSGEADILMFWNCMIIDNRKLMKERKTKKIVIWYKPIEALDGKVLSRCCINLTAANPWKIIHINLSTVLNPAREWISDKVSINIINSSKGLTEKRKNDDTVVA